MITSTKVAGWENVQPLLRDLEIGESLGQKDNGKCFSNLSSAGKSKKAMSSLLLGLLVMKLRQKGALSTGMICGENVRFLSYF